MKSLFLVSFAFVSALGCSAQVTDESITGDDGNSAFDPQISVGQAVDVTELVVKPLDPQIAAADVPVGSQQAQFIGVTLQAKHHLLRIERLRFVLESPVGAELTDEQGQPFFQNGRLTVSSNGQALTAITDPPQQAELTMEFHSVQVQPSDQPAVHIVRMDIPDPGMPAATAMLDKGYRIRMLPIEDGDVTDFGPTPIAPPLPEGVPLPLSQVDQTLAAGNPQTVVAP